MLLRTTPSKCYYLEGNEMMEIMSSLHEAPEFEHPVRIETAGSIKRAIAETFARAYVSGPCGHPHVALVNTATLDAGDDVSFLQLSRVASRGNSLLRE